MGESRYIEFQNAPILPFTTESNTLVILTASAESYTVPAEVDTVFFNCPVDFWATIGGTATIPAADVTDGSSSELNPVMRSVEEGDVISVIAGSDTTVNILCYKGD